MKQFKATVDEYNAMEHTVSSDKQKYKIVIVDEDGTEHTKSFEKTEYSKFAKLLYQDITGAIEDMGQAITEQEKRQVLIEILSELC
jgi:tRNA U34 5-carboxymethylaminomethyl modifying GTPase MnmE/TrmE